MNNTSDNKYSDDILEGRNVVEEAIRAGRPIEKILVAEGNQDRFIRHIINLAKKNNIVLVQTTRGKLDKLSSTKSHQGIIAYVSQKSYADLDDILDTCKKRLQKLFLIILDHIEDPHNLGAILRTANAVAAHGVVIPKRRAVGLNATVAKSSAGAIEHVPVARVANIAQTIDYLKSKGVWTVATQMNAPSEFYYHDFTEDVALVIGNEGDGISRLVKEKCDYSVKIPITGDIGCLNASVAASIIMYEVFKQRNSAGHIKT